jgi:enoyl-[acyl-carrier-protein] reductase (NADH)
VSAISQPCFAMASAIPHAIERLEATTRENFATAHDISSYSFTALAKGAKSMLNENGALLTVS